MIIIRQKEFGIWDWIDKIRNSDFVTKQNKKLGYQQPLPKSPRYEEMRKEKEKEIEEKLSKVSRISKYHPELVKIYKEALKSAPNWGDGDEYPNLYFTDKDDNYHKMGDFHLGCQSEPVYRWAGNGWLDVSDNNRRVVNIKSDMLKYLKSQRKCYDSKKDPYLWETEQYDDAVNHIDNIINAINKSKL